MSNPVFIEKLHLRNFRSIRSETISFDNPLFLVGRNASGKSNLVDAFAFLADCMRLPLRSVGEKRGGLGRIFNKDTPPHAPYVTFRVDFRLPTENRERGHYTLRVDVMADRSFAVGQEQCAVLTPDGGRVWFSRRADRFDTNVPGINLYLEPQGLALPLIGGTREFAPVLKAFTAMHVYDIDANKMRNPQGSEVSGALERDGSNVAGVLKHMASGARARIHELLEPIVPTPIEVMPVELKSGKFALLFDQRWSDGEGATGWDETDMSDGTLRALGLIVAAMQDPAPSLIAIEEPESSIHSGALGVISDLIEMAAERTQVVITTHSPELLDAKWIQPENLRVVTWEDDATRVAELGIVPKRALQEHLMRAGQLLRANALDAAPLPERDEESTADLFDKVPA